MAAVVESLASETGIAPDTIRNALGAIFGFLKRHLDPETLGKIQAAVPGASEVPEGDGSADPEKTGSVLGALSGVVGKVLGGKAGEGADLVSTLSKTGLDLGQIKDLLPRLVAFLEAHLPPELFEQIRSHLHLPGGVPAE